MPFTPFHLGPGTLMGVGLKKVFHIPALFLGSVIVDIEPFLVLMFKLDYPLHGFFHSLAGGLAAGGVLSGILYLVRKPLTSLMALIKLEQKTSFWFILTGASVGVILHILIDSLFHRDILPFWPLKANPFYGLIPSTIVYFICTLSLIAGVIVYVISLIISGGKHKPTHKDI